VKFINRIKEKFTLFIEGIFPFVVWFIQIMLVGYSVNFIIKITIEDINRRVEESKKIVELQENTLSNEFIDIDYINEFVVFYGKDDSGNVISYRIESDNIKEIYDLDDAKNPYVEFKTTNVNQDSTNLSSDYVIIHLHKMK